MMVIDPNERIMQDSGWADGLRGIAAVYVAASHLVLCFGRQYTNPCCTEGGTPWLFQRPILRLIASGHSWVAIFFVLLGFVNALKPIKQARSGDSDSALFGLSTAAFRRSFRLVLPASVATLISWTLCQTGAYELARNSDAYWLYTNTPVRSESWCGAIHGLIQGLMAAWRLGDGNPYDQPQWALIYLLMGSIMGYFVLLATVQLTSVWRSITITLCLFWSWSWSYNLRDPFVGYTVLGGILLAEFSVSPLPAKLAGFPLVSTVLSPILVLIGLVLMSFPSSNPDSTAWSATLKYIFATVFPPSVHFSFPRFIGSTGALILCFAILISPHLRRALSVKPLRWLGKLSFPIYLLHGTVMRTVLAWVVFAGQPLEAFPLERPTEERDTIYRFAQPGTARIATGIVLMAAVTLGASHLWANNFEPAFGKITAWAESKMKSAGNGPILTGGLSPRSPIDRPEKREG
jgi:peptidoglycan/LPS O-acetylase OafA/YrhL